MNNGAIIILGATGDLTKRKLIPALYRLFENGKLTNGALLGAALEDSDAQTIVQRSHEYIEGVNPTVWQHFCERFFYQQADFTDALAMDRLAERALALEKEFHLSGNRIVYCATAALYYCPITKHAASSGLVRKSDSSGRWHRIVYEKPFGHDLASAHAINECIAQNFDETQIYRIDHYLTKELVSNIALVRFTNCIFEPLWNNRYIDQVHIVLSETQGIDGRGAYYDNYGALRDVVQNHMLELLALVAMESPAKLTGEYIRTERARVLQKIVFVDGILGQYNGYRSEKQVAPDSRIDTAAYLYLRVNNPRWAGVPFFLKTGKCLDRKETTIYIKFKQVDCLLTRFCPSESNSLTIQIAPQSVFSFNINAKKPGYSDQTIPIKMEFCHSCLYGPTSTEAYEVLFEEILRGEQSICVRFDEIEYAWQLIDTISQQHVPMYQYEKQTEGPVQIYDFARKHGMRWR